MSARTLLGGLALAACMLAGCQSTPRMERVERVAPFRATDGAAWANVTIVYDNGVMDWVALPIACDSLFVVHPCDSIFTPGLPDTFTTVGSDTTRWYPVAGPG